MEAFLQRTSSSLRQYDILLDNWLTAAQGQWKLGGFQYLCPQSQPTRPSAALPPPLDYTSPELVLNPNPVFDHKADIFSLGCILFRLFTGQRLINVDNDEKRYKHDIKTMFPLNFADMIPPTLTRKFSLVKF